MALRLVQTPELEDYVVERRIKMTNIRLQLEWLQQLKEAQETDEELQKIKGKIKRDEEKDFHLDDNRLLCFRNRYCMPNREDIRQEILIEAHRGKFTMHPGETKMYQDMKGHFW
jgi:hypothetical protein